MDRRTFLQQASAAGLAVVVTPSGLLTTQHAAQAAPDLSEAFLHPPGPAKPQVFWYWMNGNVTRDGITRDLEAMARVGIGGVVNFDGGTLIPKGPVVYLSPEWLGLKMHAIREAERLGLEFAMHNCPGWSSSGGPWVTPGLGMQQLVWAETVVAGGARPFAALSNGGIEQLPEWYMRGAAKPADGRVAFTTWKHYTKNSPLLESGLVGPVTLWAGRTETL